MNITEEFKRPDYDPVRGAIKGVGAAALAVGAAKVGEAAARNGVPPDAALAVTAAIFGLLRNLLKFRFPRFFGWLP